MEPGGDSASASVPPKTPKVNAFQLLMASQKKSLGSNCDGKKSSSNEGRTGEDVQAQKSARKDALKKWADEKGAAKRKRDYAARGEVIDFKLEERSKRLKGMLKIDQDNQEIVVKQNGNKSKKSKPVQMINHEDSAEQSSPTTTEKGKDKRCEEPKQTECNKENKDNDSSGEEEIECDDLDSDWDDRENMGASFTNKSWKMRIRLNLGDDFNCSKPSVKEQSDEENDKEKGTEVLSLAHKFGDVEHDKEAEARDLDKIDTDTISLDDDVEEVVNVVRSTRPKPAIIVSSDDSSNENDRIKGEPKENGSISKRSTLVVSSDNGNSEQTRPIEHESRENCSGRVLRPRRSKPAILVESSDEDFDLNPSKRKEAKTTAKQKPKTIAPVFHRSQQPDRQVVEARRAFLLSGMPEVIQQRVDSERLVSSSDQAERATEFYLDYPTITSVTQTTVTYPKTDLNLPPFEPLPTPLVLPPSCRNCLVLRQGPAKKKIQVPTKTTKDVELTVLKESNPDLPVDRFHQYARRMRKNGDDTQIWTDKYQAKKVKHLLKNAESIVSLRDWLKNFNERRKRCGDDNSGSDFVMSDEDGDLYGGLTGNSVVLSGPNGCGKSNAVYAVCADLGLDVLEINASSKRTGKWLLHELQEATQSHQLNKKGSNKQSATLANNGWLNGNKSSTSSSSGGGATKSKRQEEQEKTKDAAKQKMCVLFVEDVDIIFDQDDGFIAALKEIISNSKRPVVMTTTDEDSPNVKKLMWKSIHFEPASVKTLSVWLKVICIVEDIHADLETLAELLKFNKCDLRRTLLDLQTWAGPANSDSFKRIDDLELLYWNFPAILRQIDNAATASSSSSSSSYSSSSPDNEKTKLTKLCNLYDAVIMADGITKRRHESLERPGLLYPKDSLVLEDGTESYRDRTFDEELARSLIASGLKHYCGDDYEHLVDLRPIGEEASVRRRAKRKSLDFLMDKVVRPSTGHAARNLDYMPCLCAIARSEKKRAAASRSRRRFDHFFNSHLDLNRQNNWDAIGDILKKSN